MSIIFITREGFSQQNDFHFTILRSLFSFPQRRSVLPNPLLHCVEYNLLYCRDILTGLYKICRWIPEYFLKCYLKTPFLLFFFPVSYQINSRIKKRGKNFLNWVYSTVAFFSTYCLKITSSSITNSAARKN